MGDAWPALLLAVFATHLPWFAWRWWRTREVRFAATTLTFTLLVATYALRVFAPALRVGEAPLHESVRILAWLSAALSVGLLVWHHFGKTQRG